MTTEVALPGELRVRRPKDKETLIQQLLAEHDGIFASMAEVLLFAAALGWSRGDDGRVPLKAHGEPIRFDVFKKMATAEAFIESLAVMVSPGDTEILSDSRALDRVRIFEEYANGGLAILQGELNTSRSPVAETLIDLVRDACVADRDRTSKVPSDIRKMISPRPDWS
ncbi:DNA phosphorothioation-associated protein 4 [Streptomyces chilikensis]|uniref:DNA phosphorothioation-associated protein 4 n=1 Tax=Streptomyces chilikensis TaxID=1194079 RepID=UPI000ABA3DCE|nr:DNA phosphorothioation-associated protein 4 [Streptomyces chilikensis]